MYKSDMLDMKMHLSSKIKPSFFRLALVAVTIFNILSLVMLFQKALRPMKHFQEGEFDNKDDGFQPFEAKKSSWPDDGSDILEGMSGKGMSGKITEALRSNLAQSSRLESSNTKVIEPYHSQTLTRQKKYVETPLSLNFERTINVEDVVKEGALPISLLPKVALLMSFPNSGTSFTLRNVRLASQHATASNYCNAGANTTYIPVYPDNINGPHLIKEAESYAVPTKYILTKTHCGGFCMDCSPTGYKISPEDFERECFKVCDQGEPTRHKDRPTFSPYLVGKTVHLFRSPFDNVISRFHLHLKHAIKRNDTEDLSRYPRNSDGLQAFCDDMDLKYRKQDRQVYATRVFRWSKRVPCHADFVRYVQWHNLAFDMMRYNPALEQIPVHILHYEDYHKNYNATVSSLLRFLELPWKNSHVDASTFHWSDYSKYFTKKQRRTAMKFMSLISSPETFAQLERYAT